MSFPKTIVIGGDKSIVVLNMDRVICVEFRNQGARDALWGISFLGDGQRIGPFLRDADADTIELAFEKYMQAQRNCDDMLHLDARQPLASANADGVQYA